VNALDPGHYAHFADVLDGAENDARAMEELAVAQGFRTNLLAGKDATAKNMLYEIFEAADALPSGSYFLLTFAGHGIQFPNRSDEPRIDNELRDQSWCLYDRAVIDDELRRRCWPKFADGVRVVVVIDACHSFSSPWYVDMLSACQLSDRFPSSPRIRALPQQTAALTIRQNWQFYMDILDALPESVVPKAIIGSMAACLDDENALDGKPHGLFTQALLETWNYGKFTGTHSELMSKVSAVVSGRRPAQSPATCCEGRDAIFNAKAFQI